MWWKKSRRFITFSLVVVGLAACTTIGLPDTIGDGTLTGTVVVEWKREDGFIYRKQRTDPVSFMPSFFKEGEPIVPEDMFTTGGSVPRVFWSIPGLSPWGLGPAYIIHDWIFEVHRCDRDAPPEVKAITFEQSATILAEVGNSLIKSGLIDHDMLGAIVWGVRTRYARDLWDTPGSEEDCARPDPRPLSIAARSAEGIVPIINFKIPPPMNR